MGVAPLKPPRRASLAAPAALLLLLAAARAASAQGYRLQIDNRFQAVSFEGVSLDSIPASQALTGPTGGLVSPDGYAVSCQVSGFCTFYRPGGIVHTTPVSTRVSLTAWALGIPGLSVRATARAVDDLAGAGGWPGTEPHLQLLEGYAQYAAERLTAQLGRQTVTTRFGITGFDGALLTVRDARRGLEVVGYGGWGLWNGTALPVTSPALDPLDEFRPPERSVVAGAQAGWTSARLDVRLSYQREVDPSVDYFVSERAGIDAVARPVRGWTLTAGADYDIAEGWWGSAEAVLGYTTPNGRVGATLGARRYRPHFDLWTIWGAFSPVPYHAIDGSLAVNPVDRFRLDLSGERYAFDDADAGSPLVPVETTGWRFAWNASYTASDFWSAEAGYHAEFGPGASSRGFEGSVTYHRESRVSVSAHAGTLDRPLEFRFDESSLTLFGLAADYHPLPRLRIQIDATHYGEDRQRPDAGAFNWDQWRVSGRVVIDVGGGADLSGLPRAVRDMPEAGSR